MYSLTCISFNQNVNERLEDVLSVLKGKLLGAKKTVAVTVILSTIVILSVIAFLILVIIVTSQM